MEKTLGQHRVETNFNLDKNVMIDQIKNKAAELIDLLQAARFSSGPYEGVQVEKSGEAQRLVSIAQTEVETATMYGIKACFTE